MTKNNFKTFRLDDKENEIVDGVMKEFGIGEAAAVRMIVREWAKMKTQYVTVPVMGAIRSEDGKITIAEELDRR